MIGWRNIFDSSANKKIMMNRLALIILASVIVLTYAHADNHAHATLEDVQPSSQASAQTPSRLLSELPPDITPDITPTDSIASSDIGTSDYGEIEYDQESIYIRVKKDLSLWKIANHIASAKGINVNQVMLILLKNNPRSFEQNNINSLKAKTILLFPKKPQFTLSQREAQLEIQRQHAEWSNRNSVSEKSEASSDVSVIDAQATKQANKEENESDEKVDSVYELQLQSPLTDGQHSQRAQVEFSSDWESLPEVSNDESLNNNIDIADVEMSKADSSDQRDAFEMSMYGEKLMVIADRLYEHLEQASANEMLSMIKDRFKYYYDQATTHDKLDTIVDQTKYYYDLIITRYKQELALFFIVVGVILLGFIIGRDRRRNQFLESSQQASLDPQQAYKIEALPLGEMTGRDQVLAQITHNISHQSASQVGNMIADINMRELDDVVVQEVSLETVQSSPAHSQQQEQQILTTADSTLSARDLVMAQIASRRQSVKEANILETDLAELELMEAVNKAEIYCAYGKYAQAITCLQPMFELYPDNIAFQLMLAEVYCLNQQENEFIKLAEQLLPRLQVGSREWKKLQGFSHRIVPHHSAFHPDPDIVGLEADLQTQSHKQLQNKTEKQSEAQSRYRSDSQVSTPENERTPKYHVFVESKPSNSQQEITEKELMQNAQNNSHDKFQDSFHDSSEEDDFEIEDCATQLDLAKAYVAMGDVEQAQQALNDVINRGDEAQRQQAYQLLVQLASS